MGYKIKQLATIDGNTYAVLEMDDAADITYLPDYTDGSVAYIVDDPDKMYLKISGAWALTSKTRLAPGPHIDLDGVNPFALMQMNLLFARRDEVDLNAAPETWADFQAAVRSGTIDRYFAVGDQFNVAKGEDTLVFDIVDIGNSVRNTAANGGAPVDPNYFTRFPNAKPVTFLMHDVINGVMFDNSEANYQITTEIASGSKCNISLESDTIAAATYNFTAPSALSVGGRLRINTAVQLQYYATPASAPVNIAMVAGAADAEYISIAGSLSAQNHKQRVSYGSNKYTESAIRQWLNAGGAAGSYWTSKSNYDLAPSWHSTLAGFRNGLDPDLLAVLGETTREVELNTVTDGGGQATIADNIFLPSRMEIYGSVETVGHKGLQFQSYVGLADIDRIKYDTTALSTARSWWLRSPYAGSSATPRVALSVTGELGSSTASNGIGAAAACVIL